jgi:hypothetical protein
MQQHSLGNMAAAHGPTQAAIAAAGALPALVQLLLQDGDSQVHAARALCSLARHNAPNQASIALAGASIPALVDMLSNKDYQKFAATSALRATWRLAMRRTNPQSLALVPFRIFHS